MEFKNVLALRQCVRAYTDEQLTEAQVAALLESAMAAPTAMARFERMHLTVVQDPAVLEEINALFQTAVGNPEAYPTYHAPTLIYVSCSTEDEELLAGANAGVMMENMLLTATDLGLAGVYLFGVSQVLHANPRISELLQLPEGFRTVSAIAVGHAAQPVAPRTVSADKVAVNRI